MAYLDELTQQLRDLRLPDEEMLLIDVGHMKDPNIPTHGSIRVTARKKGVTETVNALRLEDALLMVRARLDDALNKPDSLIQKVELSLDVVIEPPIEKTKWSPAGWKPPT